MHRVVCSTVSRSRFKPHYQLYIRRFSGLSYKKTNISYSVPAADIVPSIETMLLTSSVKNTILQGWAGLLRLATSSAVVRRAARRTEILALSLLLL